ncbi:hypothetical protein [Vibrio ziniensis]|uniref:Uncharacterized protein n=1 Tax=Vibrio ziniensis TaxID=2711221 RepID=A0A6G7CN51_9VIBR|nr:hypothetical protein [Vibrio ziniensis]QIH43478.1 hypothetical protein G5S32_15890 [Vibrio ziniensis]
MKVSELKIEAHLIEPFLGYLRSNNYVVVKSINANQRYWINHANTPDTSHISETDYWGSLIVPLELHPSALGFLCSGNTN